MAVGKKLFIVLGLGLSQEEKHHVYIKFPSFTKYVTMDHGSVKHTHTHNRYNRTKLWIFMTSSTASGVLKLSCLSSLVEETAPGQAKHIDDSTNLWRMICPERLQQQDRHQRLKWPGNLSINVWWFLILDHTFEKKNSINFHKIHQNWLRLLSITFKANLKLTEYNEFMWFQRCRFSLPNLTPEMSLHILCV